MSRQLTLIERTRGTAAMPMKLRGPLESPRSARVPGLACGATWPPLAGYRLRHGGARRVYPRAGRPWRGRWY